MSPASKKISLFVGDSPQKYAAPAEPCCFCSVPGVLTSEQRRRGDRRGSKVRHPGRRFSQMSISPLNPLFSWGHPLFTCWLCGCVLRLQTRSSRGLSPVSWLLLALQTPSKGDTCAARLCFFLWRMGIYSGAWGVLACSSGKLKAPVVFVIKRL